jgi:flagellar biosynthesis component FlhA
VCSFVYCVSIDRVLFCVMSVICVLCLIVVPLPPGENSFAVKINIYLCIYTGSPESIRDFPQSLLVMPGILCRLRSDSVLPNPFNY